jgi:glutamine cyclotransferase
MQALAGLLLTGFLMSAWGQSLTFPFASVFDTAPAPASTPASTGPELYSYDIIETYDHDPNAFTQGLDYDNINGQDVFWESTGMSMLCSTR